MAARRSPVFVHIEKTAGITLHNMLHRDFTTYLSPDPAQFTELRPDDLGRLCQRLVIRPAGVGGHMIVGTEDYGPHLTDEPYVFTMVRDPLARALSHLNWRRHVMGQSWSFDAFFDSPQFSNVQCRKIAGEASAEAAIACLAAFDHIGSTESFDLTIAQLAAEVPGFKPLYRSSNVKFYGAKGLAIDDLSGGQRRKLERENREDQALFDHVRTVVLPEQRRRLDPVGVATAAPSAGYRFSRRVQAKRKLSNLIVSLAGRRLAPSGRA